MNARVQFDPVVHAERFVPANVRVVATYAVQIEAEPDSLCRLLNLFALQGLTPHTVQADQRDDLLSVRIEVSGLNEPRAELIAQKMRNLICVLSVALHSHGKIL